MLENHVTSLQLSKRLKELGVKQKNFFYWFDIDEKVFFVDYEECQDRNPRAESICSAFTATELLEMLPIINGAIPKLLKGLNVTIDTVNYACLYETWNILNSCYSDKNPCDALAKMLIHLIENKIIEV